MPCHATDQLACNSEDGHTVFFFRSLSCSREVTKFANHAPYCTIAMEDAMEVSLFSVAALNLRLPKTSRRPVARVQ